MHETWKGGASWFCLFGISLQIPTEVTSPNITDTTLKGVVRPDAKWRDSEISYCFQKMVTSMAKIKSQKHKIFNKQESQKSHFFTNTKMQSLLAACKVHGGCYATHCSVLQKEGQARDLAVIQPTIEQFTHHVPIAFVNVMDLSPPPCSLLEKQHFQPLHQSTFYFISFLCTVSTSMHGMTWNSAN